MKKFPIKLQIVSGILIIAALVLVYVRGGLSLPSITAAERWKGESDMAFSQMAVYFPEDSGPDIQELYTFRVNLNSEYKDKSVETEENMRLYNDAWCTFGKLTLVSEKDKVEASVTACGGDFFYFHPYKLLSGGYFSDEELSRDLVVLDEDLAWRLFGGVDIAGQNVIIGNDVFVVSGVIRREEDKASKLSYDGGMGFYMSYEAYRARTEDCHADCYEIVMHEVVEGFAEGFLKDKFSSGQVINNSERLSFSAGVKTAKAFGTRSAQVGGIRLPYWENAARYTEDYNALYSVLIIALFVIPVLTVIFDIVFFIVLGWRKVKTAVRSRIIDIDY